jgi:proteic killer suppression protein
VPNVRSDTGDWVQSVDMPAHSRWLAGSKRRFAFARQKIGRASGLDSSHTYRLSILSDIDTIAFMIKTFADKLTAAIYQGFQVKRLPKEIQATARRKLKQIDSAASIDTLRVPPGNRLELLKGDRVGQWSIRINDQWRICFNWSDGNATDVEIADYH